MKSLELEGKIFWRSFGSAAEVQRMKCADLSAGAADPPPRTSGFCSAPAALCHLAELLLVTRRLPLAGLCPTPISSRATSVHSGKQITG